MLLEGRDRYLNSMLTLPVDQETRLPYHYSKHHLVPFGEFVPYGFHWFVRLLQIPLGDQTSGDELQAPFAVRDQWVLPNICYEDLFGEEIGAQIRHAYLQQLPQPTILLNMSNMAWFGEWLAVPQHMQISQMRALETGRPVLRSGNTGATVTISPDGKVQALLAPYTRGTLSAKVQGYAGITPYILCGNVPAVAMALLAIGGLWLRSRKSAPAALHSSS